MKIKRIVVKELFGIFDHEIPLNTDDHITIIHGPNGYGKTILLTLVNALFSSHYSKLRVVPFRKLSIDFDDKSRLCLQKNGDIRDGERKKSKNGNQLTLEYCKPRSKPKHYGIESIERRDLPFSLNIFERKITGLVRVDDFKWNYEPTQENLSLEEVLDRFGDRFGLSYKIKAEPSWWKKIRNLVNLNFIETQRLLSVLDYVAEREYIRPSPRSYDKWSMVPAVIKFSQELAEAIQAKLAEYGSLSQSLDRTFPTRLVKKKHSTEPTVEQLKTDLGKLEEKRSRLIAAGFLDKEKEIEFKDLQKIDESNINVLSVYIEDVKQKLSVFDELTDRIDLLVKLVNNRFLFKQLSINKKSGFVFTTSEGKTLPPTSLSSGEQHELVLLYEMLFKVKKESLILIDEPELSLHVAWQQQFLEDLEKVTRLVGFDVLIATHSPQIINDRWDLTVELKGPKQ